MARPTDRTEEVNRKMEEAAALGASIEEIAMYAGIHRATLYRWMKDDQELNDRIEELQERPILKARQTVVKALENADDARWYLERKKKLEFAQRTEVTGAEGKSFLPSEEERKKIDEALNG
tara:strand:+ start:1184 stop:1546 length:363 start_codon:yes stop_codon:yes gene_type:complete